jgi:short-subunit dehydrogenase
MNAIITGATKGIGRAIAEKFASKGFNLVLNSRTAADLEKTAEEIKAQFPSEKLWHRAADMSDKGQVLAFADYCLEVMDSVQILVNNAGVFLPGQLLEEPEGALEKMIETNLYSAYYLSRKIVPSMVSNQKGFIINIASIASLMAYPGGGSYGISKFALRGFSMALREELKEKGVKVTTVMPGATWSNSWEGVELPEDRLMQASDIAESIWSIFEMSPSAVVEEIVIRPQLGDL